LLNLIRAKRPGLTKRSRAGFGSRPTLHPVSWGTPKIARAFTQEEAGNKKTGQGQPVPALGTVRESPPAAKKGRPAYRWLAGHSRGPRPRGGHGRLGERCFFVFVTERRARKRGMPGRPSYSRFDQEPVGPFGAPTKAGVPGLSFRNESLSGRRSRLIQRTGFAAPAKRRQDWARVYLSGG